MPSDQRANARVKEVLSTWYPECIEPRTDTAIRDRFPIRLPRAATQSGNDRW